MSRKKIEHRCKPNHYAQVQTQLHVLRLETAHYAQYYPPSATELGLLDVVEIKYDKSWWRLHMPHLNNCWKTYSSLALEPRERLLRILALPAKRIPKKRAPKKVVVKKDPWAMIPF